MSVSDAVAAAVLLLAVGLLLGAVDFGRRRNGGPEFVSRQCLDRLNAEPDDRLTGRASPESVSLTPPSDEAAR